MRGRGRSVGGVRPSLPQLIPSSHLVSGESAMGREVRKASEKEKVPIKLFLPLSKQWPSMLTVLMNDPLFSQKVCCFVLWCFIFFSTHSLFFFSKQQEGFGSLSKYSALQGAEITSHRRLKQSPEQLYSRSLSPPRVHFSGFSSPVPSVSREALPVFHESPLFFFFSFPPLFFFFFLFLFLFLFLFFLFFLFLFLFLS